MNSAWDIAVTVFFAIGFIQIACPPFAFLIRLLLAQIIMVFVMCIASLLDLANDLIGDRIRAVKNAIGRGLRLLPFVLFELLLSLFRRGPAPEPKLKFNFEYDPSFFTTAPPPDPYAQALALLGLAQDCSEPALKAAYRAAIRKAHPDAGGSAAAAQAVIAAHDLIRQRKGWERKRAA